MRTCPICGCVCSGGPTYDMHLVWHTTLTNQPPRTKEDPR